ncbi:O-antigen ligase family protein [Microbacterium sp. 4R-513]|uniref:O-antigen ligase family protein n=1 Tax=Microbacterium sp. 4R-513 TaxID=2567934 RepID=UPI0013E1C97E|nr:O-antigen ligase family protein [Microbacterium sp. 4R-513]QIG38556.1 O-antigen ligase family protein [Microbacterium sp. 4R-513]
MVARSSAVRDTVRHGGLFVVAVLFTGIITAALLRAVDEPTLGLAVALPLVAALAVAMFLLPVHYLPAITVAVIALVPTRFIPSSSPFNAVPVLAIVMGVWMLRRIVLGQKPRGFADLPPLRAIGPRLAVYTTGGMFTAWLVFSTIRTGAGETSVGWTAAFAASALLPLLVFDARIEVRLLRSVLLWVGAIAGANIVLQMVTGGPALYALLPGGGSFGFAVYRPQGAFNHPLFAGAFLTIPAAIGIGQWLTTGRRKPLILGLLAAAGIVSTVSRSSILAVGIALGIGAVVAPFFLGWKNLGRWLFLLALGAVGAVAVLNFGPLIERSESIESQLSAGVRERIVPLALTAADYSDWMGTGPGTSGQTARLFDSIIIENSMLQLLISVGIPGLLFFLAFLGSLIWCAWARGDLGVGLAVIGYTIAITGFNSLDAVRNMHILIGFLALLAVHDGLAPAARAPRPVIRSSALEKTLTAA